MKIKDYLTAGLFGAVLFGFSAAMIFSPHKDYSMSERRKLAEFPEVNTENIKSGRFMSDFESWSLDQFPMRDTLRTVKAYASGYVFQQKDNNGFYIQDGYISRLEYPLNEKKLLLAEKKLCEVYESFIKGNGGSVYLSMIPDKNYYLAPIGGYPVMDYDYLFSSMKESLDFAEYIDISDTLSAEDFYRTDQHWRQEKITDTAALLAEKMGAEISSDFSQTLVNDEFFGTYYRQSALKIPPDSIYCLKDDITDKCTVISYETGKPKEVPVYDMEKASGRDPYEMYLCGSQAVLKIENPCADDDKKLIIFRDSFGSSIAPLLASGYSEITLVDLRYVRSEMLPKLIDFEGRDVLFLYSTLVINNTLSM